MHNLGQGIIASFEERAGGIASLREEVKGQLGELDRNHRVMARQLRSGLARGRADLQASVNAQLHYLGRGHAALTEAETRRKGEVHTFVKELDRTHRAMARQQRGELAQGRSELRARVGAQLHDLGRGHAALTEAEARRKGDVNTWLRGVARQLRTDLEPIHVALTGAETQRKAAVKALMDHVAVERAAGQKEWHRLAYAMAGKRKGAPVTEQLAAMCDRVFRYLANHPDGARLTEIEWEFDLGRLQAGRVVRHLMDEGKAEKRDYCYFAT